MTVEAMVGLTLLSVSAGLVLVRLTRPTARVMFSKVAVVTTFNGVPTLTFRLANQRRNQILEVQVSVTLVRDERTPESEWMRRFYDLQLGRQHSPIFAMTVTVMHPIDAASPLANATASSLATDAAEIVVTVTGLDETLSQPVHARTSYLAHEVLWGRRFVDVFTQTKDGRLAVDYRRFHDTEPLEPPCQASPNSQLGRKQNSIVVRCNWSATPEAAAAAVPLRGFWLGRVPEETTGAPSACGTKGQRETIPAFSIRQVVSLPIPAPSR
jgi:hypothetical protein